MYLKNPQLARGLQSVIESEQLAEQACTRQLIQKSIVDQAAPRPLYQKKTSHDLPLSVDVSNASYSLDIGLLYQGEPLRALAGAQFSPQTVVLNKGILLLSLSTSSFIQSPLEILAFILTISQPLSNFQCPLTRTRI